VLVLAVEQLRRDPAAFVERIAGFVGLPAPAPLSRGEVNVGVPALAASLKRPLNRLLVRDRLNPLGWSERAGLQIAVRRVSELGARLAPAALRARCERRLRERVAEAVGERYRESNRRTREITGIDLASLGYDL
jgi:hypothetical protein